MSSNVFFFFFLSAQKTKTQRCSVYQTVHQGEAVNPHIWEPGAIRCFHKSIDCFCCTIHHKKACVFTPAESENIHSKKPWRIRIIQFSFWGYRDVETFLIDMSMCNRDSETATYGVNDFEWKLTSKQVGVKGFEVDKYKTNMSSFCLPFSPVYTYILCLYCFSFPLTGRLLLFKDGGEVYLQQDSWGAPKKKNIMDKICLLADN